MPVIQFSDLYSGNEKWGSLAFNKNAMDSSDVWGVDEKESHRATQENKWQGGGEG